MSVEIALSMFSCYSGVGVSHHLFLFKFGLIEQVKHPAVVAVSRWSLRDFCRGAKGKLCELADRSPRGERESL